MSASEKHFEMAVELARDSLKALLLVNGGAATALIALMDKTDKAHNYTVPILFFAAGAVGAVVSSCLGYFSQLNYANHRMHNEDRKSVDAADSHKKHLIWQTTTLIAVGITLIFMLLGIITAAGIAKS